MGLSAEKKKTLRDLYETWGIEKVRKDLQRHYYPSLVSPDVSAFERDWVKSKEAQDRHKKQLAAAIRFFFLSLLAGAIIALIAS